MLVTQKKVEPVFTIKNNKEHIPLLRYDDRCILNNCLFTEIRLQSKKCFLICAYHSRSQSQEEFEIFCINFDILLSQINDEFLLCSIVTGDFNGGCTNWWKDDITNSAGREIASFTSSAGYTQIIDKPTYVINNSMLCIDLIFCFNQILPFLTNVIIGISVPLPSKYVREVWDYSKTDVQKIKKSIKGFNWGKTLESLSIDSKVDLLN